MKEGIFHIEESEETMKPFFESVFSTHCRSIVDYKDKWDVIDEALVKVCEGARFDLETVEVINWNSPLMDIEQKRIVLQMLESMKNRHMIDMYLSHG